MRFDADIKLLKFVENKVSKLDLFYDNIIDAELTLLIDNSEEAAIKGADIKVLIPSNDLFSKRHAKTFEEASDMAAEVLMQRLNKNKEKQRNMLREK